MHVLITGAGGHLGGRLFSALDAIPGYEVSGIDIRAVDHPRIYQADLSGDATWKEHLDGVDVVVHFAGDRDPAATWASAIKNNMDATLMLYHHAATSGVKRVVLASSNWLHGDKRFTDDQLDANLSPGPVNAYGMSKLFCERTGEYFTKCRNLSVICLRIGWTQWTHGNKPGPHMAMGRWGQEMWLSDSDFLSGMQAAINIADVRFAVLNLMSDNPGMRWDISTTRDVIGYLPKDGSPAELTPAIRIKSAIKKLFVFSIPRFFDQKFPGW